MGDRTGISWCDRTFNGWIGCTKVSPGCANCYADRDNHRYKWVDKWGPAGIRKRTSEANWKKPLAWNRERWIECGVCSWRGASKNAERFCPGCMHPISATGSPTRQRVFAFSLADVFEVNEQTRNWLWDFGQLIDATPNLDWLILTKRPEAINQLITDCMAGEIADLWLDRHPNVWLGTSVEDQATANERIPALLETGAALHWLSVEPQLAPVDLRHIVTEAREIRTFGENGSVNRYEAQIFFDGLSHPQGVFEKISIEGHTLKPRPHSKISWVVVGGESGPKARPFDIEWARQIRDDCLATMTPYFLKQLGGWPDKRDQLEDFPEDLRIRMFPISPSTSPHQEAA